MRSGLPADVDAKAPPFDQFTHIRRLGIDRSGHTSAPRHHLFVGRNRRSNAPMLIKLTAKPGLIYQQNLTNEIASLETLNRELPDSRYFPLLGDHGHLRDGRVYLTLSLFDEFPLATSIGNERIPSRMVAHLRTALEVAKALQQMHTVRIFHVDLNTMNVLYRLEKDRPIVRIVDFESSYDVARHGDGVPYDPPTTSGFCAPEVRERAPDARSDIYSLGAVLYTMLAGFQWTWSGEVGATVVTDRELDPDLKDTLMHAVAVDPEARYQTVAEFRAGLAAYLDRIWPGREWER